MSDFVQDFWLYRDYRPSSHLKERILPSGTIELVINLHDDQLRIYDAGARCRRFSGAVVSGAYGRSFVTDTAEECSVMGVHFKPAGAFPFLGLPPDELSDTHVDLETLWGRAAREVRWRLCEAAAPAQRFRILEEALSSHLFRPLEHHSAVAAALDEFKQSGARPTLMVREMARSIGLSERWFIRLFAAEAGLTPKLFCRIHRFQRVVAAAQGSDLASGWAGLSLHCGYFDQSHLIADFLEFSGLTPAEYVRQLRRLSERHVHRKRNHMPVGEI